jgi:hypothetical protein
MNGSTFLGLLIGLPTLASLAVAVLERTPRDGSGRSSRANPGVVTLTDIATESSSQMK